MEKSLVLVKPDAVRRGLTGAVIKRLEDEGLKLAAVRMLHMDESLARRHYAPHTEKPFFGSLVAYITSAPIVAAVFEGEGTIALIRKVAGATDPAKAEAGTLRADYGISIEENTIHASDSVETAAVEIGLFFKAEEIFG